jgi:electron transfer flavoprotein beta subunit
VVNRAACYEDNTYEGTPEVGLKHSVWSAQGITRVKTKTDAASQALWLWAAVLLSRTWSETCDEPRPVMKIVVAYKWAHNPQDATVGADGTVDWSRAKPAVSEYDPVAAELARQLADATGGEVIGLTAGTKQVDASMARKAALSRGLDRAVIVADDTLDGAGTTELAAVLAAAVRHIGDVDLVITGDSSIDVGAKMVPTVLAGQLGWPAVAEVTAVSGDAGALRVERTIAGGTQIIEISVPVVLAASADAAVPHIPGMKALMAAGKKPVETLAVADLDVPVSETTVTVTGTSRPDLKARAGQQIDTTDPAAAAAELVTALRGAGLL